MVTSIPLSMPPRRSVMQKASQIMHRATSQAEITRCDTRKQTAQTLRRLRSGYIVCQCRDPEGDSMFDKTFAERFATEWIAAWNSHDLDRVLSHYADDFEMSSPIIAQIAGEPSGKLKGKKAVGAYWSSGLKLI